MISVGSGALLLGSIICFVIKKEKNQKTPLAGTEFFNLFFGVRFFSTALDGTRKLIILIYIYIFVRGTTMHFHATTNNRIDLFLGHVHQ